MPNDVEDREDLTFSKVFTRTYDNLMNSVDPVKSSLSYVGVQDPDCQERLVCTVRRVLATFSVSEAAVQSLGWLLGSAPSYAEALRHGRELHDCKELYPKCPVLPLPFF
ncbi:uncharacterized protein LOC108676947 [Hyalella azteca]|uniref:Uncharacterized protein LOC108676947 n=1 Tax=Hyalella azteca TaxID=294128 RepID=A0A8B7P3R2_HYAAZ|nr:uncharacterized protein LOC108676947 [Hyalella azteca]